VSEKSNVRPRINNSQTVLTGCGKTLDTVILRSPPFLLADDEGSLQLLDFTTAEILRFAQNDSAEGFFRSLLSL